MEKLGELLRDPEPDRNSTERPIESANLDSWVLKVKKPPTRNIQVLGLGPLLHMCI